VNLAQAAAQTAITNAGLAVGTITQANSPTVPVGSVISQNPVAGASVAPGSSVALVISLGPANVSVPNVVNLAQAAAQTAITNAGLAVGTITQANSPTIAVGKVISQNPVSGASVAPGSSVALVISLGPANVNVPNVVNLAQAAAQTAITNAGLVVGTVTQSNSPTVPVGSVISQNPVSGASVAPSTPVDLVVSLGPGGGPQPASIELQISRVLAAGASTPIVAVVKDGTGTTISPTPAVAYVLIPDGASGGTPPTVVGGQIVTSADTRGSFTLRGTVTGTAVQGEVGVAVFDGVAASTNVAKFIKLGSAANTSSVQLGLLAEAIAANNLAAIPGINAALQAAKANAPNSGPNALYRSTAVALETGFLPSPGQLAAAGFPQTAADVTFGTLLTQINAKIVQLTAFYNTLNPASGTDDVATLNTLNSQLAALQTQLAALNVTPNGVVTQQTKINVLVGTTIPDYVNAVANRTNTVLQTNGLLASAAKPAEFLALQQPALLSPARFYGQAKPAFFGLLGLMGGSSLQMKLVNEIYGPIMQEVGRMMAVVAANGLLQQFGNFANLEGLITGASQSFHAFNLVGSVIEGEGFNRNNVSRNDVFLVGPAAVSAVTSALGGLQCKPSNIHSIQDVYNCLQSIVDAVQTIQGGYELAHQPADAIENGCILDFGENASCSELVYNAGFKDVNDTRFPSPVIVIVHNMDTGNWASILVNFVP
jgi:beta-lactam-binding protein with PASTA domain